MEQGGVRVGPTLVGNGLMVISYLVLELGSSCLGSRLVAYMVDGYEALGCPLVKHLNVELHLEFGYMGKTIQVYGFPDLLPAEVVKSFLEKHTGYGTVCALDVKQSKGGSRAFAKVQFVDNISADKIINLASKRLYFGSSYLKAWEMKTDIVQVAYVDHMDGITLNFGCQISDDKFAVLGSTEVSIKFGIGLKKIYFFLSRGSADYKLQLSYENIWQVVLHRPYGQNAQFLLIQVFPIIPNL
uniref:RNA-directed RNA polymerase, putative n=1 Tax=Solanum demissum TaxID=50514 RepID=Q0KIR1_SOLDE|nr:RNA-directed RNA polymerase, putative [Solanum demissum]